VRLPVLVLVCGFLDHARPALSDGPMDTVTINSMVCQPGLTIDTKFFLDDESGHDLPILAIAKVFHEGTRSGNAFATCVLANPAAHSVQVGPNGDTVTMGGACTGIEFVQATCRITGISCRQKIDCPTPGDVCQCVNASPVPFASSAFLKPRGNFLCVRTIVDLTTTNVKSGDTVVETSLISVDGGRGAGACPTCDCNGDGNVDPKCRTRTFNASFVVPKP
jgi:hypothetical protein